MPQKFKSVLNDKIVISISIIGDLVRNVLKCKLGNKYLYQPWLREDDYKYR